MLSRRKIDVYLFSLSQGGVLGAVDLSLVSAKTESGFIFDLREKNRI